MNIKYFFLIALFVTLNKSYSQYAAQNMTLLSVLNPEPGVGDTKYSACWGWTQPGTNREYAIACAQNGTYWVDVTNPLTPTVAAYKAGTSTNGIWREVKTYGNYCYVVCDDNGSTGFQIFDMSTLPATVTLVSSNQNLFRRGHACFVDGNKLYVSGVTYSAGANPASSSMDVYSLATPSAPVLLRRLSQDYNFITNVHDEFVRNDTVFASCGYQGLQIFKFNNGLNTFTQLGSLTTYTAQGYNHMSALTPNGQTLVFMDEVPASLPIKVANVSNLSNITISSTMNQFPQTTPHNPFMGTNRYCFASAYRDGTQLWDISNPNAPFLAGYFDTHPQTGGNNNNWTGSDYDGNWSMYPYFPSRNLFALDMENGLFMIKSHLWQNPIAGFNAPGAKCAGTSFSLTNTSIAATSYSWTFPGGNPATSTATNPTVTFSAAGVAIQVTLMAINDLSTSTTVQTLTISNINTSFTSTLATCGVCPDGAASAFITGCLAPLTFSWAPSGGNGYIASGLAPGCYTLTVTDAIGCTKSNSVCISFGMGINGNQINDSSFLVFPNPANSKITLNYQTTQTSVVNINNELGQLLYEKKFTGDVNENIDVKNFANGIYFISVTVNNQTSKQKLIINH